jgi:hypothetical protein
MRRQDLQDLGRIDRIFVSELGEKMEFNGRTTRENQSRAFKP